MTRYDEYETDQLDTILNNDQALYNIYRGALVKYNFDARKIATWLKYYVRRNAYEFYDLKRSKVNYREVAESLIEFTCEKDEYKAELIQDYKANPRKYSEFTAALYIQEENDKFHRVIALDKAKRNGKTTQKAFYVKGFTTAEADIVRTYQDGKVIYVHLIVMQHDTIIYSNRAAPYGNADEYINAILMDKDNPLIKRGYTVQIGSGEYPLK